MKSPFPGMDPFMEIRWQDLHTRLISAITDQLQEQLPDDLLAQMNERVVMEFTEKQEDDSKKLPKPRPDVSLAETEGGVAIAAPPAVEYGEAAPTSIIIEEFDYPETEPYIEIVDAKTRTRVITVIELISPTNKLAGPGRSAYLAKQTATMHAKVNLVEIDLTREGTRTAIMPWIRGLQPPVPAYLASVWRAFERDQPQREFHALPMEIALKPIAIPLRPTDPDVILHLQPLVEEAYQRGRYHLIGYTAKLKPPLSYAEQAFLEQRLAERE